jgi:hypothetical protein
MSIKQRTPEQYDAVLARAREIRIFLDEVFSDETLAMGVLTVGLSARLARMARSAEHLDYGIKLARETLEQTTRAFYEKPETMDATGL